MSTNKVSRLGLSNEEMANKYGPLSGLIGTWSGNQGVNLIAVPDQKGSFTLLVAPYYETLTVTALSSPTPNRGLKTIENGIWELLDGSTDNDNYNLARISTVPHGDAIMALGNSSETKGRPKIDPNLSSSPVLDFPTFGYGEAVYNDVYVPGFITRKPNQYLIDHLDKQEKAGQTVISSINLNVSTANNGGITNIPSINKNADATAFNSTFWIETVKDSNTGKTFQQLQYSQNTNINFPVKGTPKGKTIGWPHINVNTLIKQ